MMHGNQCEPLSFGDTLFLHLERPGMPLNVASLMLFDGPIALKDCMRFIACKLPLIPRYRQRVVSPPFHLGLPSWQPDPAFDLRHHVREIKLKRGTEREIKAAAARILSSTLDRSRPLWDFTLMQGVEAGRTAVLVRMHHCLADGLSGVELMNVLMDTNPETPALPPVRRGAVPKPAPPSPSLLECVVESCFSAAQQVLRAQAELLSVAQEVVGIRAPDSHAEQPPPGFNSNGHAPSLTELNRILPELLQPAERLPFNVVCQGPQKFEYAAIPLADLKRVKHACGTTFNNVVLSIVTAAVRRYLQEHHVPLRGRSLRIVVPVSLRRRAENGELGNHITFVPVAIPLDVARVRRLVAEVHERVRILKGSHLAEIVGLAGSLLGVVPSPLQAAIGPIASQLPLSVCNLICTDVPGPHLPLYLLGRKMLTCVPYVPIGGEMGMNCAVLTYGGVAYFGFTGDAHAVPDLARFPKLLLASFAELRKQVAPRTQQAPRAHPAAEPPGPAATVAETTAPPGRPAKPVIGFPQPARTVGSKGTNKKGLEPEKVFRAAIGA